MACLVMLPLGPGVVTGIVRKGTLAQVCTWNNKSSSLTGDSCCPGYFLGRFTLVTVDQQSHKQRQHGLSLMSVSVSSSLASRCGLLVEWI